MKRSLAAAGLAVMCALVGCGTTVGDPCTTPKECGEGVCINRSYTPGGYCTRQCVVGDAQSCPAGSKCISEGISGELDGCFLECSESSDCRSGYVCERVRDSQFTVCVGPEGI